MIIKSLAGSLLVLAVIASAVMPAMAAADTLGEAADSKFFAVAHDFSAEELQAMASMSFEERHAYFMEQLKTNLDEKIAAGELTQAEADDIYASYENIQLTVASDSGEDYSVVRITTLFNDDSVVPDLVSGENGPAFIARFRSNLEDDIEGDVTYSTAARSFTVFSEEELDALQNMTEDEKKEFFDARFKADLDARVADGTLTREEADELYEARQSGEGSVMTISSVDGVGMKMSVLSEEEISTFKEMTEDDRKAFFLSQIRANLDADVQAGRMTQEEADEIYAFHTSGSETAGNMTVASFINAVSSGESV